MRVDIHTARPGIVIGRRGAEAERLKKDLERITQNNKIQLNIQEIKQPELDAALIAQGIGDQLLRRDQLPPRDEARASRRCRRPAPWACACSARDASAARRWRAASPTARVGSRCTRCAPTSTTAFARHDLDRPHRRQGLDLQGRHPALQDLGRGEDLPRGGHGRRRDLRRRVRRIVTAGGGRAARAWRAGPVAPTSPRRGRARRRRGVATRPSVEAGSRPRPVDRRRPAREAPRRGRRDRASHAQEHHDTPHFRKEAD